MKLASSLEKLSPKEREALARWYDSDSWKALRHLVDVERMMLAKDHVDQIDIMQIRYLSGQANGLKKLILTLAKNYKDVDKK